MRKEIREFQEMISLNADIPILILNEKGRITESCGSNEIAESVFLDNKSPQKLLEHAREISKPAILSSEYGLLWGAVFEYRNDRLKSIAAIGPVTTSRLTDQELKHQMAQLSLPLTFQSGAFHYLRSVPYLSYARLCEYTLMLHYLLRHEKLSVSDLAQLSPASGHSSSAPSQGTEQRNYRYDWDLEQSLMSIIEQGQANDAKLLSKAIEGGFGLCTLSHDALIQARYSGIVMTSLCTRALIRAGSGAESSFLLGEDFLRKIAGAGTVPEIQSILKEMFDAFVQAGNTVKQIPDVSPNIQACCEYISSHLREPLSVKVLADHLHYSAPYLERKFRYEMNTSISNYITLMRLEYAKTMLITTETPVAEIAEDLHFCSSSHFSSRFRAHTGILPLAYRRQYRQK